jgi:hypothetical protein
LLPEWVLTLLPSPPIVQAQAAQQAQELADAQAAAAEAAAAKQAAAAAAAAEAEKEEMKAKATLILTQLQPPVSCTQCAWAVFGTSYKVGSRDGSERHAMESARSVIRSREERTHPCALTPSCNPCPSALQLVTQEQVDAARAGLSSKAAGDAEAAFEAERARVGEACRAELEAQAAAAAEAAAAAAAEAEVRGLAYLSAMVAGQLLGFGLCS